MWANYFDLNFSRSSDNSSLEKCDSISEEDATTATTTTMTAASSSENRAMVAGATGVERARENCRKFVESLISEIGDVVGVENNQLIKEIETDEVTMRSKWRRDS